MSNPATYDLLGLNFQARQARTPIRSAEGDKAVVWATREGALVMIPYTQALVLEGRVYQTTVGSLTTGITGGGAGTILDNEQPELRINVPTGLSIMPLRLQVTVHNQVIVADNDEAEILVAVDRTQASVTGTFTTETAINMRTDVTNAARAGVHSAFTVDTVTAVMSMELAHIVRTADLQTAVGTTWADLSLEYGNDRMPLIVGPAMLLVYFGGTAAVTGFVSAEWAEWSSGEI